MFDWSQVFGKRKRIRRDGNTEQKKKAFEKIASLKDAVDTLKSWNAQNILLIGSCARLIKGDSVKEERIKDIDIYAEIPSIEINTKWKKRQTDRGEAIQIGQFADPEMQKFYDDLWKFISRHGYDFFIKDKTGRIHQSLMLGGFRLNPIKINNKIKLG